MIRDKPLLVRFTGAERSIVVEQAAMHNMTESAYVRWRVLGEDAEPGKPPVPRVSPPRRPVVTEPASRQAKPISKADQARGRRP